MPDAAADSRELRVVVLIAYGLFLVAPFNGVTAIAGAVLAHVKRGEAKDTLWRGHIRNLLILFWTGVALSLVFVAALAQGLGGVIDAFVAHDGDLPPGFVGWVAVAVPALYLVSLVFAVWYLYRAVRGFVRALENRPY